MTEQAPEYLYEEFAEKLPEPPLFPIPFPAPEVIDEEVEDEDEPDGDGEEL